MGRPVLFDFTTGGGGSSEFLIGTVTIRPTMVHNTNAESVTLPRPSAPLHLQNGKAIHPDMAISPDGPDPAWAYEITITSGLTGNESGIRVLAGVPYGTETINFRDLPVFQNIGGLVPTVSYLVKEALSSSTEMQAAVQEGIIAADIPALAEAAVVTAGGQGYIRAADAQVYATNRLPNPMGVGIATGAQSANSTSAGIRVGVNKDVSILTTGLPAGFTSGVKGVRRDDATPAGTVGFWDLGDSASSEYAVPVTPGEVISIGAMLWVKPNPGATTCTGRIRARFWSASGTEVSFAGDSGYLPLAPSTWESRISQNILVPATAARVTIQILSQTQGISTAVGAETRVTGGIVVSGPILLAEDYGDGTRRLWSWTGAPNKSVSARVFRTDAEEAALTALLHGEQTSPVRLVIAGGDLTVDQTLDSSKVSTLLRRNGSQNKGLNLSSIKVDGVQYQDASDDLTPIRTQMGTIGANHGFTCIGVFNNPDGKTIADVGSVWTDGSREYVLLDIAVNGRLKVGGSYTGGGATPVTSANVAPSANLTHVSGATHAGAIDYTSLTPGSSNSGNEMLSPGTAQRHQLDLFVDGEPVSSDGVYQGEEVQIRETYTIVDYASLYNLSKANVGQAITTLNARGAVQVQNVYTFRGDGVMLVDHMLDELAPTTLDMCGGVQAQPLAQAGMTLRRYVPGMGVISTRDWSAGVDMTSYGTTTLMPASALAVAGQCASYHLDVLESGGAPFLGFAMGYLPNRRTADSRNQARLVAAAPKLWDMRSTKKVYPVWTAASASGWGHAEIAAFRAHLTASQVSSVVTAKASASEAAAVLASTKRLPVA